MSGERKLGRVGFKMGILLHDVFQVTLMCEVCAIINARPIGPITSDSASLFLLSPSMLLTQKSTADVKPFDNIHPVWQRNSGGAGDWNIYRFLFPRKMYLDDGKRI